MPDRGSTAIVWFRRDLRLADNPALAEALSRHARVLAVYVHAPDEERPWVPGAASRWWLHHALADLSRQLRGRLLIARGDSGAVLRELAGRCGAGAIYWNHLYEPAAIARDRVVARDLRAAGIGVRTGNAALLVEPWAVSRQGGGPYRAFTPFWNRLLADGLPPARLPEPDLADRLLEAPCPAIGAAMGLDELGLLPRVGWDSGLADAWRPDRTAALDRLSAFATDGLGDYATARERPAAGGVSRLSPYLHFGQLGPREVVAACHGAGAAAGAFLRELGWREFAHHLLYHFPQTTDAPMDERFGRFPWRRDDVQLRTWQQGSTGIPLVDAGMRELWTSGWMHNRVRMVVASFLTKNLLLPWQDGARWFWDTLVDADLANNSLGWQWTAGCGADAAPYFRVFNPVLQGERHDPGGAYLARWLPELSRLPAKWIHRPWEAPGAVLHDAGVRLGRSYPEPLVDLAGTRRRALEAWAGIKGARMAGR